jgi:predicted nucleic acid-binding Zn ribbon protein
MAANRTCPECGDKVQGRADKRFCSDYCRNVANNKLNRDSSALMRNINNRLRKNWRILDELNPKGKTKTTRNKLLSMGFDFNFITSVYTTKKGTVYYFVYDQGYLNTDEDYFLLVKRD